LSDIKQEKVEDSPLRHRDNKMPALKQKHNILRTNNL